MASPDHAATARAFHEAYERLAPAFGYETRPESAVPWDDVPEQNRALMVAVVTEVVGPLVAALAQAEHERDEARKHANKLGRELDEQGDELERAERQRDRAIEALRTIHTSPICFIDCTERVGAVLATLDPDAAT